MQHIEKQYASSHHLPTKLIGPCLIFLLAISFSCCNKAVVMEENKQIEKHSWSHDDEKTFQVEISDTTVNYNIYVNLRHSFEFEWRNLWVNMETTFPDGREFEKRVNLLMAEPDGHWHGECLGDNCDLQILIQENAFFPETGTYTFKLSQDMRVNPLPHIKSVGMRIEKYQSVTK